MFVKFNKQNTLHVPKKIIAIIFPADSTTLNFVGIGESLFIKIRLRPIPVLGIGPIPVVSVWYRYRRYCSRYQNRYQLDVTPL